MPIYDSVVDTVGGTPLVRLRRFGEGLGGVLLGKMESRNPGGSVKDRIGVAMIRDAEKRGRLEPGATIVEATSGNTGIALAFACAALGYRLVITMPETMSRERVALLRMFGAEVVLTSGAMMNGAVDKAREIARTTPGAIMLEQFDNPANPGAHESGTALEIWNDTDGEVAAVVAGVGTGGTVSGIGRVLKSKRSDVSVIAVEPAESSVLSGKPAAPHGIQGIGAGFVPGNYDESVVDEVIPIAEKLALETSRRLARDEGIFVGISAGAALAAATRVAKRSEMAGKNIVVILCDTGERYVSTPLLTDLV